MKKEIFLAVVAAVIVIAGVVVSSVFLAEDNGDFSYIRQVWFSGNTWINIRIIMLCWVIMYISTYFIMYKKEVGYFIAALFLAVFVGAGIKCFADRSYANYKAQEVVKDVVQETEATTFNINMPWLGQPVRAILSRVANVREKRFQNMVVIQYQSGVVLAPEGVVDTALVYAYTDAVAPEGVKRCLRTASYTAIWNGEKWIPARVDVVKNWDGAKWITTRVDAETRKWIYSAMEGRLELEMTPFEDTPIPSSQSYEVVNDHRIKIFYVRPEDPKRTVFQLNIVS